VASPREIADVLGEPIGRVSHHVRWLVARDFLELVRTEPRRGAVEHFYRATQRPVLADAAWRRLPAARRREMAHGLVQEILTELLDADEAGTLAARDVHLSRTLLVLDDEGRRALAAAVEELVATALRIREDSLQRLGADAGTPSELAVLHFARPAEARGA
jgi:DNA-binding MarR family transcriptional regulator